MRRRWRLAKALIGVVVGLSMGVAGCQTLGHRSVDLTRLTSPDRVEIYQGGRTVAEHAVVPGSPEDSSISRWLQAHKSGWRTDYNSYAPGRRIVGDGFDLNFSGRVCVLNYDRDGRGDWVQVSRSVDDSDSPPAVFGLDP